MGGRALGNVVIQRTGDYGKDDGEIEKKHAGDSSTLFATFATLHNSALYTTRCIIIFMTLKNQLNDSLKEAMKGGDEIGKRTLRMALAAVKQAEVDKRIELDDAAIMALLQKEVKNRRESLAEAQKANRADLIEANEAEIKVIEAFLPKAMPAEELRAIIQAAIAEAGASSPSDMGKVMKLVMPKVAGKAPNDMVSAAVKEFLQPK